MLLVKCLVEWDGPGTGPELDRGGDRDDGSGDGEAGRIGDAWTGC